MSEREDSRRGQVLTSVQAMGSMNRSMNLPQIQKIMMEFERESSMMDMKEEMMNDSIDDVMEDEEGNEEEESEGIIQEVLDEIGVSLNAQVRLSPCPKPSINSHTSQLKETPVGLAPTPNAKETESRIAEAVGGGGGGGGGGGPSSGLQDPPSSSTEADLQARLDNLRKG